MHIHANEGYLELFNYNNLDDLFYTKTQVAIKSVLSEFLPIPPLHHTWRVRYKGDKLVRGESLRGSSLLPCLKFAYLQALDKYPDEFDTM